MPVVEFYEAFRLHRNALYNKGERAMVTDAEAKEIAQQKAGFIVQDIRGYDYQPAGMTRAFTGPPSHKQIKGAPVAKS